LQTLSPRSSLDDVLAVLDQGHVAVIASDEHFHGLITRTDVLNYLRRRLR
jgi:cystathionine beta-synthase